MVISGWKEIAKYLQCGVRTAQRWTQLNGLPVHRPVQNKRGPVIALSEDLDEWIQRDRGNHKHSHDLLARHQQVIEALRRNLDEQQRLLDILRTQRLRETYGRIREG